MVCRIAAALAVCAPLSMSVAYAQSAAPAAPTFEIKRFDLSGNTLLSTERIQAIIAPYLGAARTLADVQRAQAAKIGRAHV